MLNLYIALTIGIMIGYSLSLFINEPAIHDELVLDDSYNPVKKILKGTENDN